MITGRRLPSNSASSYVDIVVLIAVIGDDDGALGCHGDVVVVWFCDDVIGRVVVVKGDVIGSVVDDLAVGGVVVM